MALRDLPDRAEVKQLVDAIQRHRLKPRELPSYVAGLGLSPELRELAAELSRLRLSPARLVEKLRQIVHNGRYSVLSFAMFMEMP